jgi:plastocyanin
MLNRNILENVKMDEKVNVMKILNLVVRRLLPKGMIPVMNGTRRKWMKPMRMYASMVALAPFPLTVPAVPDTAKHQVTYQIMTNEIKAKQPDGKEKEVYRFDPSIYVVRKGDGVTLKFWGLKGHDHPITLEGYNIHSVIHKNEATTMAFQANQVGTFRLICTAHADFAHDGPMEGYLVVLP